MELVRADQSPLKRDHSESWGLKAREDSEVATLMGKVRLLGGVRAAVSTKFTLCQNDPRLDPSW